MSARHSTSATAPSAGEQNMYFVSGGLTIGDSAISSIDIGVRRQALGFSAPLRYALAAIVGEHGRVDVVLVQVALDLHREELRRQHHAGLAVPVAEPVLRRQRVERARRMLVEADRHADVVGAGADRAVGHRQRAAAGGAAVGHVDELDAGEPEVGDERVGVARGVAAAERELHVAPADAGVGQRGTGRDGALLTPADTVGPSERVHADADDGDVVGAHRVAASSGVKANVTTSPPGVERLGDQPHRLADPQRSSRGDDARFDDHLAAEVDVPDEVRTEVGALHRVRRLRGEQLLRERPERALARQRVRSRHRRRRSAGTTPGGET